jgi:hypothetical protein
MKIYFLLIALTINIIAAVVPSVASSQETNGTTYIDRTLA